MNKHKIEIFKACFKSGLYWRGIVHDLSKYSPTEFINSAKYYQGGKSSPVFAERADKGYSIVEQHHHGRNPHHWEHWICINSNYQPIKIPIKYLREMICDHIAAGRVYIGRNWTVSTPLEHSKRALANCAWIMHEGTKKLLLEIETELAIKGFSALKKKNVQRIAKSLGYDDIPSIKNADKVLKGDDGSIINPNKIGILGGTFDPIHNGHIHMGEEALNIVDKVLFIPALEQPWKQGGVLDARIRAEMIQVAIKDNPKFELSLIELEREGKSFTIDTIKELKQRHPNSELYFICGADSFLNILEYHQGEEIARNVNLICIARIGTNPENVWKFAEELEQKYGTKVSVLEIEKNISSTQIRKNIQNDGEILCDMLPQSVAEYIEKNKLYKKSNIK